MTSVMMCGPRSSTGGVAQHTKNLVKTLSEMGMRVTWHPFYGSNVRKIYQRTLGMLLRCLQCRGDFDIIHVQFSAGTSSFCGALTGTFVSCLLQKPLILTYHNSNIPNSKLFDVCLRRTTALLLVSNNQRISVSKYYPQHTHKAAVISNGFDDQLIFPRNQHECREALDLPQEKKILLTIGNLLEVKGHKYLIEAIKKLTIEGIDIQCIVIGNGPLREILSDQICKFGLEEQVLLVGARSHAEIPLWINAADLFILPSLNEGNPTVMFEALGCGKPFVGTRVGGIPEIITSTQYGLLVDPSDVDDLADTIIDALEYEWDPIRIVHYARRFTWNCIAKSIISVYQKTGMYQD